MKKDNKSIEFVAGFEIDLELFYNDLKNRKIKKFTIVNTYTIKNKKPILKLIPVE